MPLCTATKNVRKSGCSMSLLKSDVISIFNFSHFVRYVVISHCGVSLHFMMMNNIETLTFAHLSFLYLFCAEYINILLTFYYLPFYC